MATLIICPACGTRYETKAVFPPEGRKVRCSKCSHVWQAKPVTAAAAAAQPPSAPTPAPQATPRPIPPQPRAPIAPAPQAPLPQQAGGAPIGAAPRPEYSAPPPPAAPQPEPARPPEWAPPTPQVDAEFEVDESLAAQVAEINAEVTAPPPSEKKEGFFARLTKKRTAASPIVTETDQARTDAALAEAAAAEAALADATLANADLVAEAMGEKKPPRPPGKFGVSPVTLGWAALALLVALLAGLFLFARDTVVSMLPGGSPASPTQDLAFENVRYDWTSEGGQPVLAVQGNVRNTGSSSVTVPTVVIALRDEKGEEISEFTVEVNDTELDAGEEAPFTRQIPSPPNNVRSLKVRFAKAE